jgi:lysozyme
MKTGEKGISLIRRFEGVSLRAYKCPAGIWTIGYGHTGNVAPGDKITTDTAVALLRHDLAERENFINSLNLKLTQNQFDALISLVYNIGAGNFKKSPVLEIVRANPESDKVREAFLRHVYANGTHDGKDNDGDGLIDEPGEVIMLQGLINRRNAELNLYYLKA